MRSTLLICAEVPPTLLDLKVALLTYDTVNLLDPSERDLFPSTGMAEAIGFPPIMSVPIFKPIRLIGKAPGYDNDFDAVVEAASAAIRQGSVLIIRTYQPPAPKIRIGMTDLGGFPLDLRTLLALYRAAATDPQFLAAAVKNDEWLFEETDRVFQVSETRGDADISINGSLPLPDLTFPLINEELREALSNISRARIGHIIKILGYCMTKGLVPHGFSRWQDNVVRLFMRNSAKCIDQVAGFDPHWSYRNRALRLVHDEYLNMDVLDRMSVEDVLKFRTVAWGRQAEARDRLFDAVGQIARDMSEDADFDSAVREQIRSYRQVAAEVEDERGALIFRITCEISKATLGVAGSLTAGGTIATFGTALGVAAALVGSAYFAVQKAQDLKPMSDQLKKMEEEFQSDIRFGVHNFYKYI